MSAAAPPLRFLLVLAGGWVCVRAAMLAPLWPVPPGAAATRPAAAVVKPAGELVISAAPFPVLATTIRTSARFPYSFPPAGHPLPKAAATAPLPPLPRPELLPLRWSLAAAAGLAQPPVVTPALVPTSGPLPARQRPWSLSAWLLLRDEAAPALAPAGLLGGSQAGLRFTHRIAGERRPVALSARAYVPLDSVSGAEAALGVDWRLFENLPVHLLAERRQALGSDGRSDFSLTAYGGVADRPFGAGLRFDAYAQAGVVGVEERDAFGDGVARIYRPVGRFEIGAGAWAAAQPGAARVDLGPQARLRLPVEGAYIAATAEWRFRVAGDAEPGSGPALTVGFDF